MSDTETPESIDDKTITASPPQRTAAAQPHVTASQMIWERIESERTADCRVFQVWRDRSRNPRHGGTHDFYRIEAPDWVNIVPLTSNNEVVMIEQYRHGTGEVTLEIPGGMVDDGESPSDAAARELLEETGYAPREVVRLGRARPNPALQTNWIYSFLARDVQLTKAPCFDATEHATVRLVPLAEIPGLIADGTISHALVVVGFYWLSLYERGVIPVGGPVVDGRYIGGCQFGPH